tara:strand:- start:799 stop:1290 length:492 start_codon:yes stop_codon:yes gene_type:complete
LRREAINMYAYMRGVYKEQTVKVALLSMACVLNKLARRHKVDLVITAAAKAMLDAHGAEFHRRFVFVGLYAQLSVREHATVSKASLAGVRPDKGPPGTPPTPTYPLMTLQARLHATYFRREKAEGRVWLAVESVPVLSSLYAEATGYQEGEADGAHHVELRQG